MGLISRVSSRTYRNNPQNQQKCPNKHAPTQPSSFKMKVSKSLLITSKSSSKPLVFQSNHSGQDFSPKLSPVAMSLNLLPTLVQVSVLLLPVVLLKKHQKKKPRKKNLNPKLPTPIWVLICLDKTLFEVRGWLNNISLSLNFKIN